jgi:hypothetical protein
MVFYLSFINEPTHSKKLTEKPEGPKTSPSADLFVHIDEPNTYSEDILFCDKI